MPELFSSFTITITAGDLERYGFGDITQEGLDNLASALKDTLEDHVLPELEFWQEEGELEELLLLNE